MGDRDVLAELPRRAQVRADDDRQVLTGAGKRVFAECRTFAGLPGQVREARHWLAGLIAGQRCADDAQLALSELAANAVSHSRSGSAGGTFTVGVAIGENAVRIEVSDQGGTWHSGEPASDGLCGRGLAIVAAIVSAWGVAGDHDGRVAWCELELAETGQRESIE